MVTRTSSVLVVSLSTQPKLTTLYSKSRFGKLISPSSGIESRCGCDWYATLRRVSMRWLWRSPLKPGSNSTRTVALSPGGSECSQQSTEKGVCVRSAKCSGSSVRFVIVSGVACTAMGTPRSHV